MNPHPLIRQTGLACCVLLWLLFCGGCSVKITRANPSPSLRGSAEIATFDVPSFPSPSVQELLPEGIEPRDAFYLQHSESATFEFVLGYQDRWYDYSWSSILMNLGWQQVTDPASGKVYIEAVRGPFFAINIVKKIGRLFGRHHSGPAVFTSLRLKHGFQSGWREVDGTAYQTHTYQGYMVVSTRSFVATIKNADGSESFGFRDRDGWAMTPIEIELCADLTATGRFVGQRQRGRLAVTPTPNPIEVTYRGDEWIESPLTGPDTDTGR